MPLPVVSIVLDMQAFMLHPGTIAITILSIGIAGTGVMIPTGMAATTAGTVLIGGIPAIMVGVAIGDMILTGMVVIMDGAIPTTVVTTAVVIMDEFTIAAQMELIRHVNVDIQDVVLATAVEAGVLVAIQIVLDVQERLVRASRLPEAVQVMSLLQEEMHLQAQLHA